MPDTLYSGATAEYVLTDAEVTKLDNMCPAAGDTKLGTLLKILILAANSLAARITVLEGGT